jgi:hypothetical protein
MLVEQAHFPPRGEYTLQPSGKRNLDRDPHIDLEGLMDHMESYLTSGLRQHKE